MKLLFLLFASIFLLAKCNDAGTPKNTVIAYLEAIDHFEFEKANILLSQNEENKAALQNVKNFAASLSETKKEVIISKGRNRIYNIIEKEVSKDKALIIATNNEGSFTSEITFELVLENGKWLIKNFKTNI